MKPSALIARYFDNVRYKELAGFVSGAAYAVYEALLKINVPPTVAMYFAAVTALAVAIIYLRNPKDAEWVQPAPADEKAETAG